MNEITDVPAAETTGGKISYRDMLDHFAPTGPGTLAGTYLRKFWHPVAQASDLPAGRATKITIMSEDYTLYRGETGTAHVVAHRCPHRGTQLSVGYIEGDEIRCIYHGWKFNGAGACVERPGELPGGEGKAGIKAYPTREFLGLIYAYFGEGEPPAFPPYPAFEGEGVIETYVNKFACNYFQSYENDWDIYHAKYTHRTGQLHSINFDAMLASEKYVETDFGVERTMEVGHGITNVAQLLLPTTVRLLIPANNEATRRGVGPQFRTTYIAHTPVDDHSHLFFITQLVPASTPEEVAEYHATYAEILKARAAFPSTNSVAEEMLNTTKRIDDAKDHPMLVEIEDLLAQPGQGSIADRHAEKLGRTDVGIILFRRIFARELQAVAEGRPTQAWAPLTVAPVGTMAAGYKFED